MFILYYMNNIIDNPKIKLKTYTFYINNKNDKRIFDYMTSISKNIYNCTLYCYKVWNFPHGCYPNGVRTTMFVANIDFYVTDVRKWKS
jgi:hypothetical protein